MPEPTKSGDSLDPILLPTAEGTVIDEELKVGGDTTEEAPNGVVPPVKEDEPVVSLEKKESPTTDPNTSQSDIRGRRNPQGGVQPA